MHRKIFLGILGISVLGAGLYRYRRKLVNRWLNLGPARYTVVVDRKVGMVMPDGARLAADHYAPRSQGSFPTILIRTPYGRGPSVGPTGLLPALIAQLFAERGYHVVVQDVRGRFGSGQGFEPFVHEASDGRATLDWIASQPWFNGSLGMWGQSYVGYVQWAVAPGAPAFLKALAPSISGSSLPVFGIRDRILGMDTLYRWIYQLDAMDRKSLLAAAQGLLRVLPGRMERALAEAVRSLPLQEADQILVGQPVPFYRKWLENPLIDDAYWKAVDPSPRVGEVTAAVHMVSGWYDILLRETLLDYAKLVSNGRKPYLTIGPWSHNSLECLWESLRQGLAWFDAHLKGYRAGLRQMPLRVFVMDGGGWREMEGWPPPAKETFLYLQEHGRLSDGPAEEGSSPDCYIYNPQDPTPAVGGAMMNRKAGPRDNRDLEARPDVLTYTTRPLLEALEVIGPVRLALYVRSNRPSADFFGRLCDVYPDGRSFNICDGILRLDPGQGTSQPDGSTLIELDLWATAYRFLHGHSVRLQVSSGAHPRWSRNPGTGEPAVSADTMLTAKQTIYHDPVHPSALVLPVISGSLDPSTGDR